MQFINELYQEEPGGSFTNDGKEYDLNIVLRLTDNIPIVTFNVADLKWLVDQYKSEIDHFDKNEKLRVKRADLNTPVLVTYWDNKLVVLDGFHRLIEAIRENKQTLIGKFVPEEILEKAIIKKRK